MRYVRLGQTDLKVSAVGFGTWAFGGDWGAADRHLSADDLRRIEVIVADAVPVCGPHPPQEHSAVIRTTVNDHEGSAT